MAVRKCPKCGSVWYTALVNCAFCGVEGDEVKGPISPAKLNLAHGGVSSGPPAGSKESGVTVQNQPPPPLPEPKEASPAEAAPTRVENPAPPPIPVNPTPIPEPAPPPIAAKPSPLPEPVLRPVRAPALRPVSLPEPAAPAPRIPSAIVPVVFAGLGIVAGAILPLMGVFRHHRIADLLALLGFAILSPFAPFAWFSGQRYADQCRALGFAPASAARTGRILGLLGSFLLVFEISALAILVVVQGLSGKLDCPLWK
jgi:hypothetical protein